MYPWIEKSLPPQKRILWDVASIGLGLFVFDMILFAWTAQIESPLVAMFVALVGLIYLVSVCVAWWVAFFPQSAQQHWPDEREP